MKKQIYLDHNATTPPFPEVVEEMAAALRDGFGNPSSVHAVGQRARRLLDRARDQVAELLQADPQEIVFTSGGTEANNQVLFGALETGGRILTSQVEHRAVLSPCEQLEKAGMAIGRLEVDAQGRVVPAALAQAWTPETSLVSVMLANNDVGTLQPVGEIASWVKARGGLVHTDAVQAVGKIPVRVGELGVDFLSLSGHKLGGPKGVGALFVRRAAALAPRIFGGLQERGRRAGTENVPGIVGLGKACALLRTCQDEQTRRVRALRGRLQQGLLARVPEMVVDGHPIERLPNTLHVRFADVNGEALLMNLDLLGIAVSTGSACTAGSQDPSPVLLAMGVPGDQALGSIRFSLGWNNTAGEVEETIEAVERCISSLRAQPVHPRVMG